MISDEEIKRIVRSIADTSAVDPFDSNWEFATLNFAELKSLYQLGRKHQRESDAALCNKEYWLMKETESAHHRHSIEPFRPENYGFDVGMMRKLHDKSEAILNNKDEE